MRGHEALISMRLQGKRPRAVAIETDSSKAKNLSATWPELGTGFAHIAIDPADRLERLDLRFLVALMVHLSGTDEKRVAAVFEACKAAGASRVVATVSKHVGGESEIVRMFDSEGMMWQA